MANVIMVAAVENMATIVVAVAAVPIAGMSEEAITATGITTITKSVSNKQLHYM
jgi:hypothetical protein